MKNRVLNFLKPALFAAAGILGAFATTAAASDTAALTTKMGHRLIGSNPCTQVRECQVELSPVLCTATSGQQLWGKVNPGDATCPIKLYEFQN